MGWWGTFEPQEYSFRYQIHCVNFFRVNWRAWIFSLNFPLREYFFCTSPHPLPFALVHFLMVRPLYGSSSMYESQQGPEICDVSPCIWDKLGLRLRNYSMVTNLNLRVSQYDLLTKYRRALCTSRSRGTESKSRTGTRQTRKLPFKIMMFFVSLVPVRLLLPGTPVLFHVNG